MSVAPLFIMDDPEFKRLGVGLRKILDEFKESISVAVHKQALVVTSRLREQKRQDAVRCKCSAGISQAPQV